MYCGQYGGITAPVSWAGERQLHGMSGMNGDFGDWFDEQIKSVTEGAKGGLQAIKDAAGSELTQTGLKAVIDAMRPTAAASLGKTPAETTDDDVLKYIAKIGTAGIADKVQQTLAKKADTAIFFVTVGLVAIAAALYFRGGKGTAKANGRRRR